MGNSYEQKDLHLQQTPKNTNSVRLEEGYVVLNFRGTRACFTMLT